MNVLFVCNQNVGRSQMAAALYNTLASDGHASSAGTRVEPEGQTIGVRARRSEGAWNVMHVMNEIGVDLYHKQRHAVTKDMLDEYDQIIVMADANTIPKYLHDNPRAVYWDVADPRFAGIDATRETRDELKRKVVALIESNRQKG